MFDTWVGMPPGRWHFIGEREELTEARVASIGPSKTCFLHWSWKVPAEILETYECVCFHMTDVPYGRGGSPLQNLITGAPARCSSISRFSTASETWVRNR